MTDTPQTDYIELVNHFTDHLLDHLRKLKAAPDKFALRNMIFLSLLATGLQLAPVHYESDDENTKPIVEPVSSPVEGMINAALGLHDLAEHLDDNPSLGVSGVETAYDCEQVRLEYYRDLLDQAYELVEGVLHRAIHHGDNLIAQDANDAIRGIIGLRSSVDNITDDIDEDVQ